MRRIENNRGEMNEIIIKYTKYVLLYYCYQSQYVSSDLINANIIKLHTNNWMFLT